tara:strand:- start:2957 stop:3214 length:258 start_codon:yes stop_codon:yes gene_type:complete
MRRIEKYTNMEIANKRLLKEQYDEMEQQRKQAWELGGQDDVKKDWRNVQSILYDYEKGMDDEQIEDHISNLQSHIQQLIYIMNNR